MAGVCGLSRSMAGFKWLWLREREVGGEGNGDG
jgi:hypothetical protein